MAETFEFELECAVCKEHRNRKREVLMCILDENISDNITSYLVCSRCSQMLEYEKVYGGQKYNILSKVQKQIHAIFTFINKSYDNLKNNKAKKAYLKHIADRDEFKTVKTLNEEIQK